MSPATSPSGPQEERGRPPAVRASDPEREGTVTTLRDGAAEGRLTLEELAERVERALAAATRDELEALTADLPASAPETAARARGTRWVIGIMGGDDHTGRWSIARRCTVVNVMGGADLDLREALVAGTETEITVVSVMGGSTIVVPEGVEVELGGFALMGGNDLEVKGAPARPGAPVVRVRAFSLMGGTEVRTVPGRGPSRGGT
ncbi:MAG: DUF1707 SHOCT-like domain-containing protein [Thermoleophilaceae bacterium]